MIQKHRSTSGITIRVIFAAMGNIYFGYSLAYYSITQNSIVKILGYDGENYKASLDGLINALLPVGGAVGAFFSTKMAQKFGIRRSFLICDVIGLIVVAASLYLNFYTITITRFLYGVIVGMNSALDPQYIQQISPISLSGFLGSFCQMSLLFGLTVAFVLSSIFLTSNPNTYSETMDYGILGFNSWRIIFGFPAITCIMRFLAFTFVYTQDLPQELLSRGETDKTQAALVSIYKDEYVWDQMKELEQNSTLLGKKQLSYADLFGKVYRRRLMIGQTLSLLNQWCGVNAINFYSVIIFTEISDGKITLINLLTIGSGVVSFFAALSSGLLINKFGRRIIFLIGNALCFASLSALTILYMLLSVYSESVDKDLIQRFVVAAVFIFVAAFSMSLGPVFWVYTSEILPSKGIGLVVVQNWLSLALLAQLFPIIANKAAVYVCFGAFTIVSFLGQFFIYYNVMETKKLTKAQIHNMFSFYGAPGGVNQTGLTYQTQITESLTLDNGITSNGNSP